MMNANLAKKGGIAKQTVAGCAIADAPCGYIRVGLGFY